jgi:subtilisin family serine protease
MPVRGPKLGFSEFGDFQDMAPEGKAALGELLGGVQRRITRLAFGKPSQSDSKMLARLKARIQSEPWPEDLGVIAGATPEQREPSTERLWYLDAPVGDDAESLTSVQALAEWRDKSVVAATAARTMPFALDVVEVLGNSALVVKATTDQQLHLRQQFPALEILPSAGLYPQTVQVTSLNAGVPLTVAPGEPVKSISVAVSADGQPQSDVKVRGYLLQGRYVEERTNASGVCNLRIPRSMSSQVMVSAIPDHSYWSARQDVVLADDAGAVVSIKLQKLKPSWVPSFTPRLGPSHLETDGKGVKVAVIDTGVSNEHPLIQVAGGAATVVGEVDQLDWNDAVGHGTMVAGLIAAKGDGIDTPRGLAPAAEIHAYRVFARGKLRAEGVDVGKAIRQAVLDGCDLINMSLGGTIPMLEVQRAMEWAMSQGVVCIVAAGNGRRRTVSYPACYPQAVAVSAMGRLGAYPEDSEFAFSETSDTGTNPSDYVSTFTNIGDFVDLCAPGVGIMSCWLQGRFAAQNGTSFSAPLVTGLLARALSSPAGSDILQMPKDFNRTEAIKQLATTSSVKFGFLPIHEGHGLPN